MAATTPSEPTTDVLAYLAGVAFFLAVGRCAQAPGSNRIQW